MVKRDEEFYLFGVLKYCSFRAEGRRDWEVGSWCGVRMRHMITLESIDFFIDIYVLYWNRHFIKLREDKCFIFLNFMIKI